MQCTSTCHFYVGRSRIQLTGPKATSMLQKGWQHTTWKNVNGTALMHNSCSCDWYELPMFISHLLKPIFPAFPTFDTTIVLGRLNDFTESNRLPMFLRTGIAGPNVAENQLTSNWMWHYDGQELSTPCYPMDWPKVIVLAQWNR